MNKRDKKLVLIGIRRKGESRFKIMTVTGTKGETPGIANARHSLGLALAR